MTLMDKLLKEWFAEIGGVPNHNNVAHLLVLENILRDEYGLENLWKEDIEDVLKQKITNPETGNQIQVKTGLSYKKTNKGAYQAARAKLKDSGISDEEIEKAEKDSGEKEQATQSQAEALKTLSDNRALNDEQIKTLHDSIKKQTESDSKHRDRNVALVKLVAIANGENVELTPNELGHINSMKISMSGNSGRLYMGKTFFNEISGLVNIPELSSLDLKNMIWKAAELVQKANPNIKFQFKSRAGDVDGIPPMNYEATSFKPQSLLKDEAGNIPTTKIKVGDGKEIQVIDFGVDPKDPSTNQKAVNKLLDMVESNLVNANDRTRQAFGKFKDIVSNIDPNLPAEEKSKTLANAYTDYYTETASFSSAEADTVLKDFGEMVAFMDLSLKGKSAMIPADGGYPVADIIVVNDVGENDVVSIESISIKSMKKGVSAVGAASSHAEILKILATQNPDKASEIKEYEQIIGNRLEKIDESKSSRFGPDVKKLKEAKKYSDLPLSPELQKTVENFTEKYFNDHPEIPTTAENKIAVMKELAFRMYRKNIVSELIDDNTNIGYKYGVVKVTDDGVKFAYDDEEHEFSNYKIKEKASLKVKLDKEGKIVNTYYDGGDFGLGISTGMINLKEWYEFNEAIILMKNDKIPGGVGDKTLPQDVDPKELEMGIKVEMEHTSDPELAKEIAIDHLTEDPTYYTKLATIHKEIKRVVKQTLNEIKFDKTKVISLIKKDKFLRHIVKTKKIPAEKIYSDYILPDESLRSKYLLESRVIKEAISPEDYQELKDFIRMEIASLFFDLYRKKATWI